MKTFDDNSCRHTRPQWTPYKNGRMLYLNPDVYDTFVLGVVIVYGEGLPILSTKMADDLQSSEEVSTNSNTILLKTLYYNVTNYILVVKYDH